MTKRNPRPRTSYSLAWETPADFALWRLRLLAGAFGAGLLIGVVGTLWIVVGR